MFRAFRTLPYEEKLLSLSSVEQQRIGLLEQHIKAFPITGKPLGYRFFREKRINDKRLLFLVYEELGAVLFVAVTNKETQQRDINYIKASLRQYHDFVLEKITKLR